MLREERKSNSDQFHSHRFDQTGLEPTIRHIQGEEPNHYTAEAVSGTSTKHNFANILY